MLSDYKHYKCTHTGSKTGKALESLECLKNQNNFPFLLDLLIKCERIER